MSKVAELQKQKNDAADKIRNMGKVFEANGKKWLDANQIQQWAAANKEYDDAAAAMVNAAGGIQVDARLAEIDRLQSSPSPLNIWPYGDGASSGSVSSLAPVKDQRNLHPPERVMFRDQASGRMIPALHVNESLAKFNAAARGESADEDSVSPQVGALVHSLLTGRPQGMSRSQYQNAIGSSDTAGGYVVSPMTGDGVQDLARGSAGVFRGGALTLPMQSREHRIVRVAKDPTPMWRPEGASVTGSTIAFDSTTLSAKTVAAIIPVSIEMLEDSNIAQILQQVIGAALGAEIDRVALIGKGSESEPRGVVNQSGVNTIAGVGVPTYADVTAAVGSIYGANYTGEPSSLAWLLSTREAQKFDGLVDSTGQPLQPTPWAAALRKIPTTVLPLTEGGGNESSMVIGDFTQVVVGMRTGGVGLRILDAGSVTDSSGEVHDAASQLKKLVVVHMRLDVAVIRPTWMTVLSGVTA